MPAVIGTAMEASADCRNRTTLAGSDTLSHPDDAATQSRALRRLRWAAVAAQLLVIAVVERGFDIALPLQPLLAGVTALALFNLVARAFERRAVAVPVLAALVFDLLVLCWQLYWSGGPANPFVSLFVVPIALAATWRSVRSVIVTAVLAVAAYSALWFKHRPLPHVHGEFDLHLFGMWVNFVLTALVVGFFGVRVALAMARHREALRAARERSLRDEGVLAVATLAAGAAHALNTPLSTMAVVLADLRDDARHPDLQPDLRVLSDQVDACRDAVRQLVAESRPESQRLPMPLVERVAATVTRWRLLRPAFTLSLQIDAAIAQSDIAIDHGFDHLLINLLDNAADAAAAAGEQAVGLSLRGDDGLLLIEVHDAGEGFGATTRPFATSKPEGLGLGLTLSALICERHGGTLDVSSDAQGTHVRATLAWPLPA